MTRRKIWQKPKLHFEEEFNKERRVTWLELFFDLLFVVVISQLSGKLTGEINSGKIFEFIIVFVPVWWLWIGTTFYNERFETTGLETRLFYFIVMIPLAAMSVFSKEATSTNGALFAISYLFARGFIVFLWGRAAYHVKAFRPVGKIYLTGFLTSLSLFFISIFIPPPERYYIWAVALFIESATPWFTLKKQQKLPKMSTSKRPERFGLLIIIALGEMVANLVHGIKVLHDFSLWSLITGILCISLCFALWWIYFDYIGRRVPKHNMYVAITWSNLHLPLVLCIVAAGASISNLTASKGFMPAGSSELLIGTFSAILIIIGLLELTLERDHNEPTHKKISFILKCFAGVVGLSIIPFSNQIQPVNLLLILLACYLIQIVYGAYVWFTQNIAKEELIEEQEYSNI